MFKQISCTGVQEDGLTQRDTNTCWSSPGVGFALLCALQALQGALIGFKDFFNYSNDSRFLLALKESLGMH